MWVILAVILLILFLCLYKLNENYYVLSLCKRIKPVDGSKLEDKIFVVPGAFKLFGNNFDLLKLTPETIFTYCRQTNLISKGKSCILYFLRTPVYSITTAEDAAELFQSTDVLEKSVIYDLMRPFLGDGLLISSDRKWHSRRKLLTPAFHFNVLQSFNEVFKNLFKPNEKRVKTVTHPTTKFLDHSPIWILNISQSSLNPYLQSVFRELDCSMETDCKPLCDGAIVRVEDFCAGLVPAQNILIFYHKAMTAF